MILLIRQVAITDRTDLPLIIGPLATANPDEANVIGTGLGQAALAPVTTDQAYGNEIQTAHAAANNQTASLAYASVIGDQAIASVGGGGGAGSGAGGRVGQSAAGGGRTGASTINLSIFTQTISTDYFTSNSNLSGNGSSSASVNQSVNPR